MAGIQRFITYIYAYENGEKMNNAGYAKVEIRGKEGRIEVHFMSGGALGKVDTAGSRRPKAMLPIAPAV